MSDTSVVERLRARVVDTLEAENAARPGSAQTRTERNAGWADSALALDLPEAQWLKSSCIY